MSCIRKIIESIICTRMTHWMKQNSLIPPNIFRFRHQSGTIDCVSALVADIYTSLIQKNYFNAAFLDIQSAFPSVKISKLLEITHHIGFPHLLTNYLGKLFSHLIFHFSSDKENPVQRTLYRGQPQGCPLSSILFTIYILEIAQLQIPSKILL